MNAQQAVKPQPQLLRTREELREYLDRTSAGTRGLVMTMGALHEGHLDLVRAIRPPANILVTIFVNPTQFAPGEDLEAYPRDLEADLALLSTVGVDAVFAPTPEVAYPLGEALVSIDPGPMARVFEGATRPTHFAGVCLIVAKVFNLVRPDIAAFGRKDAQQLAIIERMVADLDLPIEILPVDIRREVDGLAMSSRNAYLSPQEREAALVLSRTLFQAKNIAEGGADAHAVLDFARSALESAPGIRLDYVDIVDASTYTPVALGFTGQAIMPLAAWVGKTRLIDNTQLTF
ncbi:MAG: pantoate--beta-alanine ligase [Actinomycetaceae bacterium]|nr:pantoate--beta-alanine ligase [Actinomycetaceae bacterium]